MKQKGQQLEHAESSSKAKGHEYNACFAFK